MKKRPSLALMLILALVVSSMAQDPKTTPTPAPQTTNPQATTQPGQRQPQQDEDDVVRITTNLVQIDAVVVDKSGKQVTDLRPDEIEILEDGRPQKITNFSYVSTESGTARTTTTPPAAPADKTAPPVPPARLRPEQVRRTLAVIVDDLGLSFESTAVTRQALKKFVDQQVQPGDLVAIIRTAGGMGALQQFTSDKRQLYAAIERIKWNALGRGGISAFAPIESKDAEPKLPNQDDEDSDRSSGTPGPTDDLEQFREDIFSVGTLGAISYVVRGMRELPGRKSILLVSDGIKIFNREDPGRATRVQEALQRLTDQANRASVVIYTMDARGLPYLGLTAADSTAGRDVLSVQQALSDRNADFFESQNGLNYLAVQTGGIPIRNTNDLAAGIRRVLEDQQGYYLIGYRPDESTFDPRTGRRKFNKITLRIKRPGLVYRTRAGFFGVTDEERAAIGPRTRAQQLVSALTSPFDSGGVHLRLTSLYGNDIKAGSFVRSLLHIEARDLTFTEEPDGWHKAIFDVLAVTFGDNGTIVDQVSRTHTVRVRGETYKRSLENGFVYILTVPVKKPGAYQLRAALRDSSSERVGSASQFIEVPNINKNRLTVSGVVVRGIDASNKPKEAQAGGEAGAGSATADEGVEDFDPQAGPAVRKFHRGMTLTYGYVIYNAQVDKATNRPRLQTQLRIFRDGRQIFTGRVQPFDPSDQPDLKRLIAGGAIQLGTEMTPGEYILQVVVTDPLAKEKYRVATQWIDFEIVK